MANYIFRTPSINFQVIKVHVRLADEVENEILDLRSSAGNSLDCKGLKVSDKENRRNFN